MIASLPLAFAAMAQAVIVISGGIDLSVGAVMALTNCIAAQLMEGHGMGTGDPHLRCSCSRRPRRSGR